MCVLLQTVHIKTIQLLGNYESSTIKEYTFSKQTNVVDKVHIQ